MAKVAVGIPAATERQLFLLCGKGQTGQHILMAELGEVLPQAAWWMVRWPVAEAAAVVLRLSRWNRLVPAHAFAVAAGAPPRSSGTAKAAGSPG